MYELWKQAGKCRGHLLRVGSKVCNTCCFSAKLHKFYVVTPCYRGKRSSNFVAHSESAIYSTTAHARNPHATSAAFRTLSSSP